uniref:Ring finger domain protein n=1 Tax=Marseillevirus LCMAC101 TaxID=2506602 RepID=A0A481YTC1_9VIRU|nr:MAG: ring finger domain protein [Marseillevirus LCMAC101]
MSHVTSVISTLCGLCCVIGCISCYKCRKNPDTESSDYSAAEETSPICTKRSLKRDPLIAGADLASEDIECSICLEGYEVGQSIEVLSCMHFYHEKCLCTWNNEHIECPQCREDIEILIID